jgi:hypothetical protein
MTQNNMGYMDQDTFEETQNNMIYANQQFNRQPYNLPSDQVPVVYGQPWSKKKLRDKMKGFKKFRPHSNNVRTINQINYNNGIWGMNKNFRKKFDKKSNFGPTSGLSKKCDFI